MNSRERFVNTLLFNKTDKIPFQPGHPRESTLKVWRTQGLPEGVNHFDHLCKLIGIDPNDAGTRTENPGINFEMMPRFEEKVLEKKDGHLIVQDWKGNICEISDQFDVTYLRQAKDFVTRRWIKCPVENRADWEEMKLRYNPSEPGRFPSDFEQRIAAWNKPDRSSVLGISLSGPFWQLREWLGFEELCMKLIDDPELIRDMVSFWTEFISKTMKPLISRVKIDHCLINEDMAYKTRAMISPAMTREFIKPAYDRWVGELKASGCRVIEVDSDGFVGDLIPIWIESGFNTCSPMEVAAGCDLNDFRKTFDGKISFRGGVDKRKMAKGGAEIADELNRLSPVIRNGGYIPGCDHGVPFDVSWPDFVEYGKLLAKECGW